MHTLIHLSDIHFGHGDEPKPLEAVVAAIRGLSGEPSSASIVLSGDVAYSGKAEQYGLASNYVLGLREAIQTQLGVDCAVIACPGNHDCDFPDDSAVRDLVVERIRNTGKLPDSQDMIRQCTNVQASFFSWARSVDAAPPEDDGTYLAWTVRRQFADETKIDFRVLNTAWMSTISEAQGSLFFPTSLLPELTGDVVRVSVLHHPYAWFQSSNGRDLRRALEAGSDIILTGHEHDHDSYKVTRAPADQAGYVEGGALAGVHSDGPSFSVIQVDVLASRYRVIPLTWRDSLFSSGAAQAEWLPFVSRSGAAASEQRLSDEMSRFLSDPGLQLTHPAKTLALEDIFVPPDLRDYEHPNHLRGNGASVVRSTNCINQLFEDCHVYLLGDNQCGKTSLGKMLYLQALRRKRTPVLLTGREIRHAEEQHLRKLVAQALQKQYKALTPEEFWQSDPDARVLIVDDFGATSLNAIGRDEFAERLRRNFGAVFLLGGDLTQVEDLIARRGEDGGLAGFRRYEIRPFGYLLRDTLIEKWITAGREHELASDVVQQRLRESANVVDRVLGKNLVPSNPVYVLILLQQLEARVPLDTRSGSYGYFYEALVTLALQRSSRSPEGVDAKYTYLSELASRMFAQERPEMDEEQLDAFTREHLDQFRLNRSPDEFKREVLESRLLSFIYGKYRFAYRYSLYYFVARHMRDNTDDQDIQQWLEKAVDAIHQEDFANILIFYTYLTKSKAAVRLVLQKAKGLFGNVAPCNMGEHVSFVGRLQDKVLEIILPDVDAREQRRAALSRRDEADTGPEAAGAPRAEENGTKDAATEDELKLMLSLNSAIKTLQVLGQILRNFSGSLRKEMKLEITRECFDLGLRVLNTFFGTLERHLDKAILALGDLFGKDLLKLPEGRREEAARKFVFLLTEVMSLSTLRRISYAVGSEALIRTYEDVEEIYDNRATRFVQLCLRLDHCSQFPEQRVLDLHKEVRSEPFGLTLLRMLVAEHLYQFERPFRVRQSISSQIGLQYRPALPKPRRTSPEQKPTKS